MTKRGRRDAQERPAKRNQFLGVASASAYPQEFMLQATAGATSMSTRNRRYILCRYMQHVQTSAYRRIIALAAGGACTQFQSIKAAMENTIAAIKGKSHSE